MTADPWAGAPYPPRAWQTSALPVAMRALRSRHKAVISACTGAGKTALFAAITRRILTTLDDGWVVVVTVPSQSLVRQTADVVDLWCGEGTAGRFYASSKTLGRVVVVCHPSAGLLVQELASAGLRVAVWLADECHRLGDVVAVMESASPVTRLGFTGTPFRSVAHERLEAWDVVAVRYGLADALADGVIVPPRFVFPEHDSDHIDHTIAVAREAVGPGVVSAVDIEDAEWVAEELRRAGVRCEAVHSRLKPEENRARLERLERGDLKCVTNVGLLVEGVDLPWLRWGCMRREEKASVRAMQHLGRYLRCDGGRRWGGKNLPAKTEAVIYDRCNSYGARDLDPDAALGEAAEALEARMCAEAIGEPEPTETLLASTVAMTQLEAWLRELSIHAQLYGARRPEQVAGGVTEAQLRSLRAYSEQRWRGIRRLPKETREALKALILSPHLELMTAAGANDLLAVARAAVDRERALQKQFGFSFRFPAGATTPGPPTFAVTSIKPVKAKRKKGK